jgi:DNA-binding beta-propeller fold protein YncE
VGNIAGKGSGEGVYDIFDDTIDSLSTAFDDQGLLDREPFVFDLVRDKAPGAALSYPGKLEVDKKGKRLFVSDSTHNRIVVFKPDVEITQVIGSGEAGFADGRYEESTFFRPQGLAYDPRTDVLYVADTENHLVRRVDLEAGTVKTVLGTGYQGSYTSKGMGPDVAINSPWDLTIMGDHLYIAMAGPHQIWRMDLETLEAERYAGTGREDIVDGPRERASLAQPSGIDNDGHRLFFADSEVSAVRIVDDDMVRTIVGTGLFDFGDMDGKLDVARFQHPIGLRYDGDSLLVADTYNHKVKLIDLELGTVHTLVGSGESGDEDAQRTQ